MERKFKILRLTLGSYATNCYILFSNEEAIIIDPAAEAEKIIKAIEDNNLKPTKILLTHAHPDHFGALDEVRNHFGIEAYISKNDEEMLERRSKELNRMLGINSYLKAEHYYSEGDIINFSGGDIRVLETPGHTPGGVCLLIDDILISGDTLFYGSIGRTDLPGGDYDTLMSSLKKLTNLNDNILVLPGHGQETQIGFEKIYNPFLQRL